MSKVISFASDFGLNDGSVGVVKGVISRIDESIKVNDYKSVVEPNIEFTSKLLEEGETRADKTEADKTEADKTEEGESIVKKLTNIFD